MKQRPLMDFFCIRLGDLADQAGWHDLARRLTLPVLRRAHAKIREDARRKRGGS